MSTSSSPRTPSQIPLQTLTNSSSLSSTYQLPLDLKIQHYRKAQVRIHAHSTSTQDKERIDSVKFAIKSFHSTSSSAPTSTSTILTSPSTPSKTASITPKIIQEINLNLNTNTNTRTADDLISQLSSLSLENSSKNLSPVSSSAPSTSISISTSTSMTPTMPTEQEEELLSRYHSQFIQHRTSKRIPFHLTHNKTPSLPPTPRPLDIITLPAPPPTSPKVFYPIPSLSHKRQQKLYQFMHSIEAIREAKNIVVVMGAGLSVPAGIPDFRSENGLYELLKGVNLGNTAGDDFSPMELFDLKYFITNPVPFYTFYYKMGIAGEMCQPTFTHRFLKLLQDRGQLRTIYTQNIDNLEDKAGLNCHVACHGNDKEFYCIGCGLSIQRVFLEEWLQGHKVPYCKEIRQYLIDKYGTQVQQSPASSSSSQSPLPLQLPFLKEQLHKIKTSKCNFVWKPRIVFFGESLPKEFFTRLKNDLGKADLIIIMGTSLQVMPVASIPHHLSDNCGVLGDQTALEEVTKLPCCAGLGLPSKASLQPSSFLQHQNDPQVHSIQSSSSSSSSFASSSSSSSSSVSQQHSDDNEPSSPSVPISTTHPTAPPSTQSSTPPTSPPTPPSTTPTPKNPPKLLGQVHFPQIFTKKGDLRPEYDYVASCQTCSTLLLPLDQLQLHLQPPAAQPSQLPHHLQPIHSPSTPPSFSTPLPSLPSPTPAPTPISAADNTMTITTIPNPFYHGTYSSLDRPKRNVVLHHWLLHRYDSLKHKVDQDNINLTSLARDLTHVPIISINRDSLMPLSHRASQQYHGNDGDDESDDDVQQNNNSNNNSNITTTQSMLQEKLSTLFTGIKFRIPPLNEDDEEDFDHDHDHDHNNDNDNDTVINTNRHNSDRTSSSKASKNTPLFKKNAFSPQDDLSDGEIEDWYDNGAGDDEECIYTSTTAAALPHISHVGDSHLHRCDYEFLGNADDVCRFLCKKLNW